MLSSISQAERKHLQQKFPTGITQFRLFPLICNPLFQKAKNKGAIVYSVLVILLLIIIITIVLLLILVYISVEVNIPVFTVNLAHLVIYQGENMQHKSSKILIPVLLYYFNYELLAIIISR